MQDDAPRALVIASVLAEGADASALFTGDGYGPPLLTAAEQAAIAATPPEPPPHVRGEYPAFLEPELQRAFGGRLLDEMLALQSRAPADLRANTLKTTRDELLDELRAQNFDANATPYSPFGIRLAEGSAALGRSALFEQGAFEFQDEAAQIASILCASKPGDRVLDLAAGAGGKSLALAALMRNEGEIAATDIRAAALDELAKRAARAGASIIQPTQNAAGLFDVVLLDAPCSGTGTWRRQPELRWKLTPDVLSNRMATQDALLDRAAAHVRPGGRLVYATCSILSCENQDRIAAFRARHPHFAPRAAAEIWRETAQTAAPPGMGEDFAASPFATGTDGFFTAILINNGCVHAVAGQEGGVNPKSAYDSSRPRRRFRLPGDTAHRPARPRSRRLLRDRPLQQGRAGHRRRCAASDHPVGRARFRHRKRHAARAASRVRDGRAGARASAMAR